MCWLSRNLGASTSWNPKGLSRPVMGLLYMLWYCILFLRCCGGDGVKADEIPLQSLCGLCQPVEVLVASKIYYSEHFCEHNDQMTKANTGRYGGVGSNRLGGDVGGVWSWLTYDNLLVYPQIHWKVRENPQLAHHSLNCLVQLASLNGTVFADKDVRVQYLANYMQNFLNLVTR
jgi:hypothetical protein